MAGAYFRPLDGQMFTPLLDAVMNEYFVGLWRGTLPTQEHWELQLQQAEEAAREGKAFIAVAQGERGDVERLRYALASFLLVANQRAYSNIRTTRRLSRPGSMTTIWRRWDSQRLAGIAPEASGSANLNVGEYRSTRPHIVAGSRPMDAVRSMSSGGLLGYWSVRTGPETQKNDRRHESWESKLAPPSPWLGDEPMEPFQLQSPHPVRCPRSHASQIVEDTPDANPHGYPGRLEIPFYPLLLCWGAIRHEHDVSPARSGDRGARV